MRGPRRTLKTAREIVGPGMIAALQSPGITTALQHFMPAMAADVDEPVQPSLATDHRNGDQPADISRDVVADIPHLIRRTDIGPGLYDDLTEFLLGDGRTGLPAGWQCPTTVKPLDQRSVMHGM